MLYKCMHCASFCGCWMEATTSFLWHITEEAKEPASRLGEPLKSFIFATTHFWIIKLHDPCATAQSRSHSLLLALGLLALGTCSISYTTPSSCCGQVGNGLFCFIFVSYLGIFLDWSVNWISWTYPQEHLASVQGKQHGTGRGTEGDAFRQFPSCQPACGSCETMV